MKRPLYLWESGFADGRSKASPDSEQIEQAVAKPQMRNSVSVEQIQDRAKFVNERSEFTNSGEGKYLRKQTVTNLSHKRSFASLKMTSVGHSEQREESHKLDCFARPADGGNGARNDGKTFPPMEGNARTKRHKCLLKSCYSGYLLFFCVIN